MSGKQEYKRSESAGSPQRGSAGARREANCSKIFGTKLEAAAFLEGVEFVLDRAAEEMGAGCAPIEAIGVEPDAGGGWAALLFDVDAE